MGSPDLKILSKRLEGTIKVVKTLENMKEMFEKRGANKLQNRVRRQEEFEVMKKRE